MRQTLERGRSRNFREYVENMKWQSITKRRYEKIITFHAKQNEKCTCYVCRDTGCQDICHVWLKE